MFSGGGMAWADAAMKRGEIAVAAGAARRASRSLRPVVPLRGNPGLARRWCCRSWWRRRRARAPEPFRAAIEQIAAIVERTPDASRPVPGQRLRFTWPPKGADLEARASRRPGESVRARKIKVLALTLLYFLIMHFGIRVGSFVPAKYTRELVDNSDFRKFDDSLRMVLDCTPALADEIEQHLAECAARSIVRYGTHRQDAAMMTCFTPSPTRSNHVHFIDGAMGGYAMAASALKQRG